MGSTDAVAAFVRDHTDELVALRRKLHAHPEVGFTEHRTTHTVVDLLNEAGIDVRRLPGTGAIADIGTSGPRVALRADLDALPIADTKDVPYRSRVDGVAHACGHDVHTTVLVGCALALVSAQPPGRIRFLFQPAEEKMPGGALDVIEAGGLDDVERIFGLHCDPRLEVGVFGVRTGAITGASDAVTIRLGGPGGHTARPHLTVDLVAVAGRVAADLPALLPRSSDVRAAQTLVFGAISGGSAANVIPRSVELRGTYRTLDQDAWDAAPKVVDRLARSIAEPYGATVELDHERGVPPVQNDPRCTEVLQKAAESICEDVVEAEQSMGAEDFAWYTERIPGSFGRLGVAPPGRVGDWPDLHAPSFDVDEGAIAYGVRVLSQAAIDAVTR